MDDLQPTLDLIARKLEAQKKNLPEYEELNVKETTTNESLTFKPKLNAIVAQPK
jgi:hypothetical protein